MKYIKGITIFVTLLIISSALTSNTSLNHLNNNQAYASIDIHNNFKEIGEKIKKACPAYQGNLDINIIKGLVTDVLKACLPNSNLPPTTPNPNPNPNVQNATLDVVAINESPNYVDYQISVSWGPNLTTGGPSTSPLPFNLQGNQGAFVSEVYTIPFGYQYQVSALAMFENYRDNYLLWEGDCTSGFNQILCLGTISKTDNTVRLIVCSFTTESECPP